MVDGHADLDPGVVLDVGRVERGQVGVDHLGCDVERLVG